MAIPTPPPSFLAGPEIELIYTLVICLLCFLIYFKTKELYELTKHKGIQYFRYAFLFFGLAYASRLLVSLLMVGTIALDLFIPPGHMIGISMMLLSLLSTLAIFFLFYSTIWKRVKGMLLLTISTILIVAMFVVSFLTRSLVIVTLIQLLLLVATVIISTIAHRKDKKISQTRVMYLLVSLFWLASLFIVGPIRFRLFWLELVLMVISAAAFALIYFRVLKWTS
jgi:hypothetical protein